jgi:hypothetical protein
MLAACNSRALAGTTLTDSNEPLYGRTDIKSPMVYSSMVHVAGGEGGSTRHDGEMPGPAPRVDLVQSTALKASIFMPRKEGGADCYSIRVDGNYRAHGKYDRDESVWSAVEIGTDKAMGHG